MSGPRRLTDQLVTLRKAIARTEIKLDALRREWFEAGALCCPGCMFPGLYMDLEEKQERRRAWLEIAEAKVARHAS